MSPLATRPADPRGRLLPVSRGRRRLAGREPWGARGATSVLRGGGSLLRSGGSDARRSRAAPDFPHERPEVHRHGTPRPVLRQAFARTLRFEIDAGAPSGGGGGGAAVRRGRGA